MKHWPFKVINDSTKPKMEVEYKGEIKTFFPEEISSMVLTKMKEISEAYLGKVDKCRMLEMTLSCWLTQSMLWEDASKHFSAFTALDSLERCDHTNAKY